jgi:PAS domain S-box-containing protein/putative nucleotidyltransferase with HDIG domain
MKNDLKKLLIRASQDWRATFDSMPHGVILLDKDFKFRKVNDYISRLTGIPIKEMIDRNVSELLHEEKIPIVNILKKCSTGCRTAQNYEIFEPSLNKYFMINITPLLNEKGHAESYVGSIMDITELKAKEKMLSDSKEAFLNMLRDVNASNIELKNLKNALIVSFANTIDAKSPWTKGHSERVTDYSLAIAREMNFQLRKMDILKIASLLHDTGKIGIPDAILDKDSKLSDEEYQILKKHPEKGEEILKPIKELEEILPIIRSHHERLDGRGYPDGLRGERIPLDSRIISVTDSYDAMVSDRPYRPSKGRDFAVSELKRNSGTQFDPAIVEIFLKILP